MRSERRNDSKVEVVYACRGNSGCGHAQGWHDAKGCHFPGCPCRIQVYTNKKEVPGARPNAR